MGWRYLLFTLGGITLLMWGIRFFVFTLFESPRYLVGIGKDAQAVEIIHKIAAFNGKTSSLTLEDLEKVGMTEYQERRGMVKRGGQNIKALFKTKKMALSTSLLISLWGIIGLASTLYNSFLPYLLVSHAHQRCP
jgi:hypothetical protein